MTEEEREEELTMLAMYAGIALPGVMGRSSYLDSSQVIAKQAFDIAEAMIVEYKNRKNVSES